MAAAVFEVHICSRLAAAEACDNPLRAHSTYPVVLEENARLAIPTVKQLASLSAIGRPPRWTAKALSRKDNRTAFTMPQVPGDTATNVSISRDDIRLPCVGAESRLVLTPLRRRRQEGSNRFDDTADTRASASASANSSPVEGSSAGLDLSHRQPAWYWISDWQIDLTDPASSPVNGWSYACSFDAPKDEWRSDPSQELRDILEGSVHQSLGGKKWIRRRRWVRVMRRRVDIEPWGWGQAESGSTSSAVLRHDASTGDYLARAHFLAGPQAPATVSDSVSVRSGKTALGPDDSTPRRRAELRKMAARLERAVDELRTGLLADDEEESRARAQGDLEGYLHQLAALQDEIGAEEDRSDGNARGPMPFCARD